MNLVEVIWATLLVILTAWTYTALAAVFLARRGATSARGIAIVGWMALVASVAFGLTPSGRGMAPGVAVVTVLGISGYGILMFLDVPDAESRVTSLGSRVSGHESRVTSLGSRVSGRRSRNL